MAHSEQTTAVVTANEPPDGSVLIIKDGDGFRIIERDDTVAAERSANPNERWFDCADGLADPMPLYQHLKYADTVYALGEKLAEFR